MEKIEYSEKTLKNKKNNSTLKTIFMVLISFTIGVGVMYLYSVNNPKIETKNKTISETKVTEVAMEDAIEKVYDSVVCIEVLDQSGNAISTGTGFVYKKDSKYGYVLTNAHVVNGGTNIQATLSNNSLVKLTLLGMDTYTDLAVLKMDAKEVLQVASIGTSANTKTGNTVFTVGSPMGASYAGTVTKGILSGKDRLIETNSGLSNGETYIIKVLQTDAAISPGNSGGPLVNLAGDVIGINSLKLVDEKVEGMGFAIPIEDALKFVDVIEKGQSIQRPLMGVQILDLRNEYILYRYNVKVPDNVKEGIYLVKVNGNSPAGNAGLKDGDVITNIDGQKVTTTAQFRYELYKHSVGDIIDVSYYRNGKEKKTSVKLDKAN